MIRFIVTKLKSEKEEASYKCHILFFDKYHWLPEIDIEREAEGTKFKEGVMLLRDTLLKALYGLENLDEVEQKELDREYLLLTSNLIRDIDHMWAGEQQIFVATKSIMSSYTGIRTYKESRNGAMIPKSDTIRFRAKSTGGFFRQINILFLDEHEDWNMETLLYTSEPGEVERAWRGHQHLFFVLHQSFFYKCEENKESYLKFKETLLGWANKARAFDEAIFVAKKSGEGIEFYQEGGVVTTSDTISSEMKLPETEPMEFKLTRVFGNPTAQVDVEFLGGVADEPKTQLVKLRDGQWVFISRIYKVFIEKHLRQDITAEKLDNMLKEFEKFIEQNVEEMKVGESRTFAIETDTFGTIVCKESSRTQKKVGERITLYVDGTKFEDVENVRVDEASRMVYFEQRLLDKSHNKSWMIFTTLTMKRFEA